MENRYLFRAKRIDNGEWVTGNLIQNPFLKECEVGFHPSKKIKHD